MEVVIVIIFLIVLAVISLWITKSSKKEEDESVTTEKVGEEEKSSGETDLSDTSSHSEDDQVKVGDGNTDKDGSGTRGPGTRKRRKSSSVFRRKPKTYLLGLRIEDLPYGSGEVPSFVKQCVEFIEAKGISNEGIYRVPAVLSEVDGFLHKFDEDDTIVLESLEPTINTVASAIKKFFRSLHEPLIPRKTQQNLLKKIANEAEMTDEQFFIDLCDGLRKVPEKRILLLKYMMAHFKRITDHSEENKMTKENLVTCWLPSLMQPKSKSIEDFSREQIHLSSIFKVLLEKSDQIFEEVKREPSPEKHKLGFKTITRKLLSQKTFNSPLFEQVT